MIGSIGCGGSDDAGDPDSAGSMRANTGVILEPAKAKVGDSLAGVRLVRISTHASTDGTLLGSARFKGKIRLTGQTFAHPEFPDVTSVCFEADSVSAVRMPRWAGDRRRAWFCFENSVAAASLLALPGEVRPAEIEIDDFTIVRGMSDEVNSAKLVGVTRRANLVSSPYAALRTSRIPLVELESAAKKIVYFLQGKEPFDSTLFADTVNLYVSPEGGAAKKALPREQLRNSNNWVVASTKPISIRPSASLTKLTVRTGVHFNCLEYPLATRFPELAKLPHVGVKLEPQRRESCMQTWNLTMVFNATARPPVLVAAVYDQWEW